MSIAAVLATATKEEIESRVDAGGPQLRRPSGKARIAPFMPMGLLEQIDVIVRTKQTSGCMQTTVALVVHDMLYSTQVSDWMADDHATSARLAALIEPRAQRHIVLVASSSVTSHFRSQPPRLQVRRWPQHSDELTQLIQRRGSSLNPA